MTEQDLNLGVSSPEATRHTSGGTLGIVADQPVGKDLTRHVVGSAHQLPRGSDSHFMILGGKSSPGQTPEDGVGMENNTALSGASPRVALPMSLGS